MQTRESDYIQNTDISFIRDCVIELKKNSICYAYKRWQVDEIQKLYKRRYNVETSYRINDWYYVIRICN